MNPSYPTPIHLDTLAVIEAARAAHAYGLLTAQAPDPVNRRCSYEYAGRVCAIGAAVPEKALDREGRVATLIRNGTFEGNARELGAIQNAHDDWVTGIIDETAFLRTLSEVGGRHG